MMAAKRNTAWRLADLLDDPAGVDVEVHGLALDSRAVRPGDAFFAVQGSREHGVAWLRDAVASGATAILTDLDVDDPRVVERSAGVPVVHIGRDRARVGEIAARFYGDPTGRLQVIAVTGTNGKTSISWLLACALEAIGRDAAMLGTLGVGRPRALERRSLTTPDPISLQRDCAELVASGVGALVMEASSHAIDQARIGGVAIDVAMFSNLTRDHLDYHGDMAHYFEAKAALFERDGLSRRVVCIDDEAGRTLARRHADALRVTTRTNAATADLWVTRLQTGADGLVIDWATADDAGRLASPLIGAFNAQNLMLALAAMIAIGVPAGAASEALATVSAPPGRLQRVQAQRPAVFVDYAHTPDALAQALQAIRGHTDGALWCVFGCGGERDRGKRASMARAAETFADRVVVTSDNPRSENPARIIDDIVAGFTAAPARVFVERRDAIRWVITEASDDDAVLIAGKGHETTQTIGAEQLPFDDVAEARLALAARGGRTP